MVKLKLFVIYIQIFRCLPQHINLPVPKVPVPKEPHITTIFQHYATGNPMQMGETRLVSVQPNVYPACTLDPNENWDPRPSYYSGNIFMIYYIKRRATDQVERNRPRRARYHYAATRRPLVRVDEVTNEIHPLDRFRDPHHGDFIMLNMVGRGANRGLYGHMRSVYCENSRMKPIEVRNPNWNNPAIGGHYDLTNWHRCGVLEKLIRECMVDTNVIGPRNGGPNQDILMELFHAIFSDEQNPHGADVMGVFTLVQNSCDKLFEVQMITTRPTHPYRNIKYQLGKYILQAALDANYQYMVVQGNPETVCVNPERTWSAINTRQVLDLNGERYHAFYEGTVTQSQIGNWYFCMA